MAKFDKTDFAALMWILAIIAVVAGCYLLWGLPGGLLAFGGIFLFWEAMRQVVGAR